MSREISVRVATPEDDSPVDDLLSLSYPVLMRSSYDDAVLAAALPLMTRANPDLLSSGTYYIAEMGCGRMVGCGGWTREQPGSGNVVPGLGHIRHFATHPDWVRRGVGRAIYERCQSDARLARVRRLECFASLNGLRFYESLGFEAIRPIDIPMGARLKFPSVLMERSI